MVTAQEVHSITFDKGLRGYNLDQVDDFLDRVAEQLTADEQSISALKQDNEELKDKLLELAQKLDSYRNDENALKSALLNAQRMGENVIKEARQKGDAIERESRIRSEDILRAGMEKIREQELELERIKSEVAQFKASVLGLYKIHIESLSKLPDNHPVEQDPIAEPAAQPEEEPVVKSEEVAVQPEETMDVDLSAEETAAPVEEENFWPQDEEELTAEIAAPMSENSDTFRGITFSD